MPENTCFCGNHLPFEQCCRLFLAEERIPETAEQLMRSRYSAFVTQNEHYLLSSWHASQRPSDLTFSGSTQWLGLNVKQTRAGQVEDCEGWMEFVARYKEHGRAHRIEELSYFVKESGKWFYVSGEHKPPKTAKK